MTEEDPPSITFTLRSVPRVAFLSSLLGFVASYSDSEGRFFCYYFGTAVLVSAYLWWKNAHSD